mmetsp:Transcript_21015/g.58442  ORF Transcript_21015/g.58442 Transcript_21015/m.58442 type:complete len:231 (+) Transcript_21015:3612-4304(+)
MVTTIVFVCIEREFIRMMFNRSVCLLLEEEGLTQQQHRNGSKCAEKKKILHKGLASKDGLVHKSGCKCNIDQGGNQTRWLTTTTRTSIIQWASVNGFIAIFTAVPHWRTVTVSTFLHHAWLPVVMPFITGWVKASGKSHSCIPVDSPFREDQNNHVDEQRRENYHRKNLKVKVCLLSEINCVETSDACTQEHLADSKNNAHFHFEGVEEQKFIRRHMPNWIQTKRINRFI